MEGTASTVVCDTPSVLRNHVLFCASAANPGNLRSLMLPSVPSSGHNGASSSCNQRTLTSSGFTTTDDPGMLFAGATVVATDTIAAAGSQMTDCDEKTNITSTTGARTDIHEIHARTAFIRA
jgi:hypothetical protein